MELELKVNNRQAIIKEIKREGTLLTLSIDDQLYEVDIVKVNNHEFSILYNGHSHNVEVIESKDAKHYHVNMLYDKFNIEVIDNESRYRRNRTHPALINRDNIIRSPMPGKVVRLNVKPGDRVEADQPLVVLSAMKMESEFKAGTKGIVLEVAVKVGDTVETNQLLVKIDQEEGANTSSPAIEK